MSDNTSVKLIRSVVTSTGRAMGLDGNPDDQMPILVSQKRRRIPSFELCKKTGIELMTKKMISQRSG